MLDPCVRQDCPETLKSALWNFLRSFQMFGIFRNPRYAWVKNSNRETPNLAESNVTLPNLSLSKLVARGIDE